MPWSASKQWLLGGCCAGKRISMRKVIAYIASHFRKDKIWLRRSRPDKRRYQVRLQHAHALRTHCVHARATARPECRHARPAGASPPA